MEIIIPNLPPINFYTSPALVKALDKIRYNINDKDRNGDLWEFYWFAREYPRYYRYHLDHALHRLTSIHKNYGLIKKEVMKSLKGRKTLGMGISNPTSHEIYWDFEAYLNALNAALDLMARVIGVAYPIQTPISFNKLCSKKTLKGPVEILQRSKIRWVDRLKDYRDCFVHYTPVDNCVFGEVIPTKKGNILRCKLPTNPNIRTVAGFKYSRKVEVLTYASTLYRNFSALDKAVAKEIKKLYREKEFPKRTTNLFFIGHRAK